MLRAHKEHRRGPHKVRWRRTPTTGREEGSSARGDRDALESQEEGRQSGAGAEGRSKIVAKQMKDPSLGGENMGLVGAVESVLQGNA